MCDLDELVLTRESPDSVVASFAKFLLEQGQSSPIEVNERREVLLGDAWVLAMRKLGWKRAAVKVKQSNRNYLIIMTRVECKRVEVVVDAKSEEEARAVLVEDPPDRDQFETVGSMEVVDRVEEISDAEA